jgi:SnoaL-like domain
MPRAAEELAAELAIINVVSRLAMSSDHGGLDEYVDAFEAEATIELPTGTLRGRGEIRTLAEARRTEGTGGPGSNSRHVVTNTSVAFLGLDEAEAVSYFVFFETTSTAPVVASFGNYRDRFRRSEGIWRLARRTVALG